MLQRPRGALIRRSRTIRLGRNLPLEERLAPAVVGGVSDIPVPLAKEPGPGVPMLTAPAMPGLADLDAAVASAVRRAWEVPVGTTSDRWIIRLSPGVGTEHLSELGAAEFAALEYWPGAYGVRLSAGRDVAAFAGQVAAGGGVEFFYPLFARQEIPRFTPNDALFPNEWHLNNTGQSGGTAGNDAHVTNVWDMTTTGGTPIRGDGVLIGIVDDGLQHAHPDLQPNYVAADSWDFNFHLPDPNPDPTVDHYGTAVASVAAGKGNNAIGVAGAAFDASLAGLRLIAAATTDLEEANALGFHKQNIDIYNNSWGPFDNSVQAGPGPLTLSALQDGYLNGRGGLGNIYTWAAGNGLESNDNVNYDGYANSRYVIAVGAIDDNGRQAFYSEPGAPMLVTAYSSGNVSGITTTDITGANGYSTTDYTNDFGGTSSASPLAAGVIALMLQANPNLTARDVQHILVRTARQNDSGDLDWITNAGGHHVNHKYGFGAIDAEAAVNLAKTWTNVAPLATATTGTIVVNQAIQDPIINPPPEPPVTFPISSSVNMPINMKMEHVEVEFHAQHTYRGDLQIILTAPSGTRSILAEQHFGDPGEDYDWVFSSVRHWDEFSFGTWTLEVVDLAELDVGTFQNWTLRIYGSAPSVAPFLAGIESGNLNYLENQTVPITSALTISDPDSTQMTGGKVSITTNFTAAEDQLVFTNQNGITGNYASGVLTLTGTASKADYETALRSVQYHNTSETPTTATRTASFQVTDPDGLTSNFATRNITITLVNDPPSFAVGPNVSVPEDSPAQTIDPWATAISPGPGETTQSVSFEVVSNSNPGLFAAGPAVSPTGVLTFTPAPDASGSATIEIHAVDDGGTANGGQNISAPQSFVITITPENDAPVAIGDVFNVIEDTVLTVTVPGALGNDKDADGNPLTATQLSDPAHGSVTFNADGSFTYTPVANFSGTDSFTYVANDGIVDSAPGTVTIKVGPVNDRPDAIDDAFNAKAGRPLYLTVLANDTDVDGDPLRVSSYTRAAKGRLSRSGNGLVYTANPGASGPDSFNYTVSDGKGGLDTATVTLAVTDSTPPRVTAVRLHFGPAGRSVIDLRSLNRNILPWANITGIDFVFSEDVTVALGDLSLTGAQGGPVTLGFSYNPASRTASWTAAGGLPIDRYTLRLSAAAIVDQGGNPLAANWARTFAVLPGDVDGNGIVDDKDLKRIKRSYTKPGKPVAELADVNGDGNVDAADYDAAAANKGKRAP